MHFRISTILEYSIWLLKKYSEYYKFNENNIYRIIEIKPLDFGTYKIIAQVIGKASIFECSPEEIVKKDQILEGFSKKDIRTIAFLACQKIKKPKFKILEQNFSENHKQIVFKIATDSKEKFSIKTANEILMDRMLVDNLSAEDLKSISYMAGYECAQINNNELKNKII